MTKNQPTLQERMDAMRAQAIHYAMNQLRRITDIDDVFEAMDRVDVVYAVWPDRTERLGFGTRMVKGIELMQRSVATGNSVDFRMTGIPCADEDFACLLEIAYARRTQTKQ